MCAIIHVVIYTQNSAAYKSVKFSNRLKTIQLFVIEIMFENIEMRICYISINCVYFYP